MRSATKRWEWFVAGAPVICALLVYAVAQDRWLVSAPLIAGTLWALSRGRFVERQPWKLSVTATVGGLIGLIFFLQENAHPGPVPPVILSPLTAALAALCCYVLLSRQTMFAWLYAWLLAVLSLLLPPQGPIVVVFLLLVLSTLACCFVFGGGAKVSAAGTAGFLVFAASVTGIGYQLVRLALGSEEMLLTQVSRWLMDWEPIGGVGLQSEIALGNRSSVGRSNRVLMEVEGKRPEYLRAHIMERFDGALWSQGEVARTPALPVAETPTLIEQPMMLLERMDNVIPVPAGTKRVDGVSARPERGWVWRSPEPTKGTVVVHRTEREVLPPEAAPGPTATFVPENMQEEFRRLAVGIVGHQGNARQRAERLERFFQSEFLYSLNTDLRGEGHPLAVLIREKRPAYCIYFASAMAVLLRSVDVPARLVGGFAPTEVNRFTKRTIVRARDAHAWVEVYLPEEGRWVTFDPTPSQSREEVLEEDRSQWLGMLWDAFTSMVRRGWWAFKEDPFGTIAAAVTSVPGLVVLALLIAWQVRKRWGGLVIRRREVALESSDPELRAAYRRYKALLRRVRIEPAADETDDDVVDRLRRDVSESSARAAESFLADYRRARYAGGAKERLGESLRAMESSLKRAG